MKRVLERLLKPIPEEEVIGKYLKSINTSDKILRKKKNPGRPAIPKEKKARNITLCLAPSYLEFLDKMVIKSQKVSGRGRKIRFIIERFIEHEKRSIGQMKVLKEALEDVESTLKTFKQKENSKKKVTISPKEKVDIDRVVQNTNILIGLLNYTPKSLQQRLSGRHWEILSFCFNWSNHKMSVKL